MKKLLTLSLLLLALFSVGQQRFALGDSAFLLDGKPFQVISGEIHYTRVPREAWRHRMQMAKAMGLNTIGTYVFWNVHEPQNNVFDFSGNNDIAEFVRTAAEEGLWVILRPSPYVCAEWEFGGYPFWLQKLGLKVRSMDTVYLREYRQYIQEVGRQLAPLQVHRGGNILMVQVENEYGSYGSDKEYLETNRKMFVEAGFDGLLYTCDPANDVAKGSLPGLLPAVNGVDKPQQVRTLVQQNNSGKGPYFIAEWYPAWFDWWGTPHHTVPAEKYTGRLDTVLRSGISINMYMFHGGSTRGFMNGANYNDRKPFEPQISSYDYDAPLDEAGNATDKFMRFREVIQQYTSEVLPPVPAPKKAVSFANVKMTAARSLFSQLPQAKRSEKPLSFEDLDQPYGFVLYRTTLDGGSAGILKIRDLRDYALVLINGKRVGVLDRRLKQDSLVLTLPKGKVQLDILVENMGRINFGPYLLKNEKGITEEVLFNGRPVYNWQQFSLPLEKVSNIRNETRQGEAPLLLKGSFTIGDPADTYLDMRSWSKGLVWINGHNLGRYWSIGPQQTLYVPAEWLKKGRNEVVVLDLLPGGTRELRFLDHAILNELK